MKRQIKAAAIAAAAGIVMLAGLPPEAIAQATNSSTSTTVDIQPLLTSVVLPFAGSLLGLLGVWALRQVEVRLGLDKNTQLSATLERAMSNGLAYAQSQMAAKVAAGPLPVDLKSESVAIAARYAADHVPDAIKSLGITPELLAQKIEARLSLNTTPRAESIAVPTPLSATAS
jgi:hypothetical protein